MLTTQSSKLKADIPGERVKLWSDHFNNLLGSPPKISDQDEPILTVFETLDISEEPFSADEFNSAIKKTIPVGRHVVMMVSHQNSSITVA